MEMEWGAVDRWPVKFSRDWESVRGGGSEVVFTWFEKVKAVIFGGRKAIIFLDRILEGDGFRTTDEYRNFWLEVYQLAASIFNGVLGLEHKLDFAMSVYPSLH
jgi:hypothetical protein